MSFEMTTQISKMDVMKRGYSMNRNPLISMVGGAGIEPATSTV
jgi:hypothetical protein